MVKNSRIEKEISEINSKLLHMWGKKAIEMTI